MGKKNSRQSQTCCEAGTESHDSEW